MPQQKPPTPDNLADWLTLLEQRHPKAIDMGLERTTQVKNQLDIRFDCPVITVAGTNGKGSTCAMLESILMRAGYRVGLYIKPHFLHFNERARLRGEPASDAMLIAAFEAVEAARGEISLTYFEFTTLAIMKLLADAHLDVVILEVGLGGRLDAVNVIDADVSIVTSIDIDHTDYLGSTREAIGFERPASIAPARLPSAATHAAAIADQARRRHRCRSVADGPRLQLHGRQAAMELWRSAQRRNSLAYPACAAPISY